MKVLRRLLPALILVLPAFLLTANPAPRVDSIDDSEFRLDLGPGVRLQTLDASSGVG